jgi:transcription elongation factor GreA
MGPVLYLRLLHRHCSGRWQSQLLPADEIENRSVRNKCEEDAKMREQLTESDVKKIQEEIDYRKLVVRKEAIEAVKEARAHGDLSENFEYHAAKKDKNSNESRIRYLERMLKNANVITDHSKADEVGINKTVQVYFEEDDETETYRLVTSIRGNSLHNLISIESPLGKALMGHRVGDRIYIKVNDQYGYYVEIRSIENTQDESEDQIRKF